MKKLGNLKILVRPGKNEQEEKVVNGIIIPSTFRHKKILTQAEVIQCGTGTPDIPMEVKSGDRILFHDSDNRLKIEDCVLIEMGEVLFVLD